MSSELSLDNISLKVPSLKQIKTMKIDCVIFTPLKKQAIELIDMFEFESLKDKTEQEMRNELLSFWEKYKKETGYGIRNGKIYGVGDRQCFLSPDLMYRNRYFIFKEK